LFLHPENEYHYCDYNNSYDENCYVVNVDLQGSPKQLCHQFDVKKAIEGGRNRIDNRPTHDYPDEGFHPNGKILHDHSLLIRPAVLPSRTRHSFGLKQRRTAEVLKKDKESKHAKTEVPI
jgi:hypothetical protein